MITVTCTTNKCENENIAIPLEVPNDQLVICGCCGAVLNGVAPIPPS